MSTMRASDDVLKQRRILTAHRGGKSVSPPPSRQRNVATAHRVSTPPRSPFTANGSASGRKIVRAARVQRPVVPPRYSTSAMPFTESASGSNKNLTPHGQRTLRAARREDDSPRPPLPCQTPPRPPAKRNSINAASASWEKSMKAALMYVAMTGSQATNSNENRSSNRS
eukprot:scaffold34596_cov116-Skeletonema_dohrnii-CCMP3373.AAC.6